jgi:hypothetical protein
MAHSHLDSDTDAALRTSLQQGLHAELAHIDPEAGLAQLHTRLQADAAHAPVRAPQPAWHDSLRRWFTRWPTALASLVIVLQAGLLAWQNHAPQEAAVAWRGAEIDALRAGTTAVVVQFAPQASLQEVSALLHSLQAEAVAGPDARGQWTLALPATQAEAALASLRASPLVHSATAP